MGSQEVTGTKRYTLLHAWASAVGGIRGPWLENPGGAWPPPWIFKHDTNIVDRGLRVLFFGLFLLFSVFFPLASP